MHYAHQGIERVEIYTFNICDGECGDIYTCYPVHIMTEAPCILLRIMYIEVYQQTKKNRSITPSNPNHKKKFIF
jgi:hypothetical protein